MDLDQAIQEMSIKDDELLVLSNQAQFCSIERNDCSILGRFLNPSPQRMSNWILDMPRIWRLYSTVRGVALSQERFQFFFKSEDDLIEILKTGVWTQDEWCVVMDRWIEKPTEEYLMFLPVWIRLRNIPVNYYTEETIKEIASCVGHVLKVELDLEKSQAQDYIIVHVILDVRNPLRNFKEVQLPTGEIVSVTFDYERIRKRCFLCQRLTHEKAGCGSSQTGKSSFMDAVQRNSIAERVDKGMNEPKFKQAGLPSSLSETDWFEGKRVLTKKSGQLLSERMMATLSDAQRLCGVEETRTDSQELCDHRKAFQDGSFLSDNLDLDVESGFHSVLNDAGTSGLSIRQKNSRKRKATLVRKKQDSQEPNGKANDKEVSINIEFANVLKRKKDVAASVMSDCSKDNETTVVHDEPPQYQ